MRTILTLAVLLVLQSVASAQDKPKVVFEPVLEMANYERLYVYTDGRASSYVNSGSTYATTQKGLSVSFMGTGHWSTRMRFTLGALATPTEFYNHSNGLHESLPFARSINAVTSFTGSSRSIEVEEQYHRGMLTYQFGMNFRMLQKNTINDLFDSNYGILHDESTLTDNYVGPHAGVEARKNFHGFTAKASVGTSPWLRYHGTYEDRQRNWGDSLYQGTTHSSAFDVDLGGSYEMVPNRVNIVAGWRMAQVRTQNSEFYLANPYGISHTPQHDTWRGPYVSVQLMH